MAGEPHFVLFPFMAQGHMIPMVDFGRVLARRRAIVTLVTTPHNAARFETTIHRDRDALGLRISIVKIPFPWKEAGLPEGTENQDQLPPSVPAMEFMAAASLLQDPVEKLFQTLSPPPNCIISDGCLPFTMKIAAKFNIPRISFHVFNCFYSLVMHNSHNLLHTHQNEDENFVVPNLPDRIEISKSRAPPPIPQNLKDFQILLGRAEMSSHGTVLNTFEEMEPKYVEGLKSKRGRVWCVGPVSLCNTEPTDKAQRGKKSAIDEHSCLSWLDSQNPNSVLYVCFGSLCNLILSQLTELALGLEASKRPFIWAIRKGPNSNSEELEKWVSENGFENRIQGRGVLIWGWAPQVLILSHPSVGGFLTHCGANGIQEGICAGVPLMSWPLFSDQFINEQLVLRVLKIGVSAGAKYPVNEGEEEKHGVQVKKEDVRAAIDELMDEESEDSKERRRRVKELAEKARSAVVEGGSSHRNVSLLIKHILEYQKPDVDSA